jgi:26S proteasome regulatory subunit T5
MDSKDIWGAEEVEVDAEILAMTVDEIKTRTRLLENNISAMKADCNRLDYDIRQQKARTEDNKKKLKDNKKLPYLVANVVEVLDPSKQEDGEEDGGAADMDDERKEKSLVIKTTTRQTVYLPVMGLAGDDLEPGDLVGVNKDSYLVFEKLPSEYDSRVQAMELDEKPTEDYTDVGGLDKQIQELQEAVVLPMTQADKFTKIGIRPPKGVLMYGPPGTGKTLLARACAKQTDAVFLKLAGPQLVQMYIGDGAKMVRDAFELAKEKCKDRGGAIIFIDEIDAIGTKRFNADQSGDREVQRTMLELLNQLDGFASDERIKVIAATNRPDILDPALMRSGRLDRKVELPHPNERAREKILQIHSRKMNVDTEVNFEELSRSTEDFNGAMLKAVCVEAGMIALRRDATTIMHEDFVEGVSAVQMKKKQALQYYA